MIMKCLLGSTWLILICCSTAFSQKSQLNIARNSIGKLQVAINNKQDVNKQLGVIGEGIKASEAAQNDRKTKKWPETWAIKAYLSSYLAIIDPNEGNSEKYFNSAKEAIDSASRLDKFQSNSKLIQASIFNINIKKQAKATAAFNNNDFTTAYNLLAEVSNFFPTDTSLATNAALAAQNIRKFDDALIFFKRAKDNGIKNPTVFQNMAAIYTSKLDNDLAIRTLEDGLKLNPYDTNLTNNYINLLLDHGKFNEAIKVIESSIKVNTNNKLLYFLYGYLHQHNSNYNTAELAYSKALAIDENYFDALYQLGVAYVDSANEALKEKKADSGQKFVSLINRAEVTLLQAHEINQNDKSTVQLLVEIYTRKNRLDRVQELKSTLEEF